jgi:hypothetical protein
LSEIDKYKKFLTLRTNFEFFLSFRKTDKGSLQYIRLAVQRETASFDSKIDFTDFRKYSKQFDCVRIILKLSYKSFELSAVR